MFDLRLALYAISSLLLLHLGGCASLESTLGDENLFDVSGEIASQAVDIEAEVMRPLPKTNDAVVDITLFDVSVEDTPLPVFLMGLVEDTLYNIVVHPDVTGNVNLSLKQVSVVDVLEILRDMHNLHLEVKGRLIQVMPNTMETSLFSLDYVNLSRQGTSDMRVSTGSIRDAETGNNNSGSNSGSNSGNNNNSGNNSDSSQSGDTVGSRVTTESTTDLWMNLRQAISSLIGTGDGRKVTVMEQAGVIVVRALRSELSIVSEFLQLSEFSLTRQVILEAKILEVVLEDRFERGIDWRAFGDIGGEKRGQYDFGIDSSRVKNPSGLEGVFTSSLSVADFDAIIQVLESQGTVKVLSSPRISTVNNQKAVIKVGTDEFFVTNVTSTTTTGTSTTTTPSVTLTPFFSGIALDVTPQISKDGDVILHIHPTVSEVTDQNKVVTIGDDIVTLPLALSTIRESDSIVRARNRQIIVIGGLLKNTTRDISAGLPFVNKIPFLGLGFSQKRETLERSELVILVRPIVGDPDDQHKDVLDSLRRLNNLGVR